jgi:hypothetical protein
MKNDMIWGFLIHLGSNMWAKKGTTWHRNIHPEDFGYKDKMFCDMTVWRKVTDFLPSCGINTLVIDIGEGLRLDSHPEIATEGALTKSELRAELERLRSIGLNPIPKYNFSCRHNAWMGEWAYMVGTRAYYDFCKDIIEETIELFDTPDFFHLGLDEEIPTAEHAINVCRSPEKKMEDALYLFEICNSQGVKPWIWLDVDGYGGWDHLSEKIPKNVIISTWYYGAIHDKASLSDPQIPKEALYNIELQKRGFTQIPTVSTFDWHCNAKDTMNFCKKHVPEGSVIGFMTAPWLLTTESRLYGLYNDAYTFYHARKDILG